MEIFEDPHVRDVFDVSSGQPRLDPSRGWSNALDQFSLEELVRIDYERWNRVEPATWVEAGQRIRDLLENHLSDSIAPGWTKFCVWAVGAIGIVLVKEWNLPDPGLEFLTWTVATAEERTWMLEPKDGPVASVYRDATAILDASGSPRAGITQEFRHLDLATTKIAELSKVLEALSVQTEPLDVGSYGSAFAVRNNDADCFVVVAFSAAGSSAVYLRAGVLHHISAPRPSVLEACNRASFQTGYSCIVTDEGDIATVLEARYPPAVLLEIPQFFSIHLGEFAGLPQMARRRFEEQGVDGRPFNWSNGDAARLVTRDLMARAA
jgi:hypothetical protein